MTIKAYSLSIPQPDLDYLQNRLQGARWPEVLEGAGWERGVPVRYLRDLAAYWSGTYNWRREEARLNAYDQFMTTIDGQPIHFFHVRSREPDGLPLLLLHGWPSTGIEYLRVIDRLVAPRASGEEGPPFHLIIPTIPGFGLSAPVREVGWQSVRTAKAYRELMARLGYSRYGAHGSDIGADILGELGKIDPDRLIGAHLATDTITLVISLGMFMGGENPVDNRLLTDGERERVKQILAGWEEDMGYLKIQATKPQTLGYGLQDSPVAQLAWQVEKFRGWTNPPGEPVERKIDLDQMLTIISLYWFTGAGVTSANYIYENMHAQRDWGAESPVPTGYAVFAAESFARKLVDPDHRMRHWSEFKRGQHFPAMEVPDLLVRDIRKFFRDRIADQLGRST
jgi:pimeloyl-ACP methyl ester carboxylesterase